MCTPLQWNFLRPKAQRQKMVNWICEGVSTAPEDHLTDRSIPGALVGSKVHRT